MIGAVKVLCTNEAPLTDLAPLTDVACIIRGDTGLTPISRDRVLRIAPTLDAIINQGELTVNAELLGAAPRLKIVANVAIGVDNLAPSLMAERGVWATHVPNDFAEAVADCTLALLLAVARKVVRADAYVRSGQWAKDGFAPGSWDGLALQGRTLGIVGYGRIGAQVHQRAQAFGMNVIFTTHAPRNDVAWRSLDQLLAESDVVSLHVPLTPQTRGMIGAAELARMKRGSILLNFARGACVDEAALVEALQSEHLGGAGLDVFEDEPRPHPALLQMGCVVLTPHVGGGTRESRRAARLTAAGDVARVLRGQSPCHPVNRPPDHARLAPPVAHP